MFVLVLLFCLMPLFASLPVWRVFALGLICVTFDCFGVVCLLFCSLTTALFWCVCYRLC